MGSFGRTTFSRNLHILWRCNQEKTYMLETGKTKLNLGKWYKPSGNDIMPNQLNGEFHLDWFFYQKKSYIVFVGCQRLTMILATQKEFWQRHSYDQNGLKWW